MTENGRHYINEGLYLIRLFIESEKESTLSLDDCYYLLKDSIIPIDEIGFDILDFVVTKEIIYTDSQRGYAGQNSTLGTAGVTHIGCNRYPDYFTVDGMDDLLNNLWDVALIAEIDPVRQTYVNSEYVIRYLKTHSRLFKDLETKILNALEKKKNHTKLAIFM